MALLSKRELKDLNEIRKMNKCGEVENFLISMQKKKRGSKWKPKKQVLIKKTLWQRFYQWVKTLCRGGE